MKKENRSVIKTKRAIKTAFTDLLGEKKDLDELTVVEICDRADVAKSTFYYHYADVFSIAEEIEGELTEILLSELELLNDGTSTNYASMIRKTVSIMEKNEDAFRKVITASSVTLFIEKLKIIISKKIFEENVEFNFSTDSREKYAQVRFLTNACVDTAADYFKGVIDLSLAELGEIFIAAFDKLQRN